MKINLFASEEQFPELIKPVQMAFDTKGRLWVASWVTYPHWNSIGKMKSTSLLILEDTNGDGKANICKAFAEDLHNPTGFCKVLEWWSSSCRRGRKSCISKTRTATTSTTSKIASFTDWIRRTRTIRQTALHSILEARCTSRRERSITHKLKRLGAKASAFACCQRSGLPI